MQSKNSYNNVKFSFVIPVYNVEHYLAQCVNSILTQNYLNYEVILVDDGSTDSSGTLCDKFAQIDSRICVIHQENAGLSEARNTGIRNADGEYILFVDSDDYIAPGILDKLNNTIIQNIGVDVVFLEAVKIYPNGKTEPMRDGYKIKSICGKTKDEVLKHITTLSKFPGSAWAKAIRRALLDNTMLFTKNLLSEDIDWSYRLFKTAEKYAYLPDTYYYYRQAREGSITNKISEKNVESMLWIVEKWANQNPTDPYQAFVNSFVAYQYMVLLLSLSKLEKQKAEEYWKRAADLKWIIHYGKSTKLRFVDICVRLIGIKHTARLLRIYKEH